MVNEPELVSNANSSFQTYIRYFKYPSCGINNSNAELNFGGGPSGNVAHRHVYGPQRAKPYIEEEEGVLDNMSANFEKIQRKNRCLLNLRYFFLKMTPKRVGPGQGYINT